VAQEFVDGHETKAVVEKSVNDQFHSFDSLAAVPRARVDAIMEDQNATRAHL
jgi:hypothetical protein